MDFLIKLLAIDYPENTTLESADLSFRGPVPFMLAGLILMLLALFVAFLYRMERGTVTVVRRLLLIVFRLGLIALLLFLLLRPVLLAEFQGERPRSIALLLDNSESMKIQDHRMTDPDKVRVAIAKGLVPLETKVDTLQDDKILAQVPVDPSRAKMADWILVHEKLQILESLKKRGPLQPYLFGRRLQGLESQADISQTEKEKTLAEQLLARFKAEEGRTALADSILDILHKKDAELPAAMVILSDGQDNASKFTLQEAALECARMQVPLYIYGVGSPEGGSLQLKEMLAPGTIFVDDTLQVPLRWRAQGFKKGNVELTLTLDGKRVARKEIPIANGDDLREVLSFTVEKDQLRKENPELVAEIRLVGNDKFKDKLPPRRVQVVDGKIKVLYIENTPRFEFKYLQAALLRDRRVDAHFILVQGDPKVTQGGPPFLPGMPATRDKFFDAKYDLIILGDVASSYFGKEGLEWIKDFVKLRGGLVCIAGRENMPASYEKPLDEIFPIKYAAEKFPAEAEFKTRTQEYPLTLTELGKMTDWLVLEDTPEENLKLWETLPGFHWNYPVTDLQAGATDLAVNPRVKMGDKGKRSMPVLASHFYGEGQVLFLGTDETWRWRKDVQPAEKIFSRFWGQIIYQMGLPHLLNQTAPRVQIGLDRSKAIQGQPVSIYVRLFDKFYKPRKEKEVEATLEYLDAREDQERRWKLKINPRSEAGREGEYSVLHEHQEPGRYRITIHQPEPATYEYRVERPVGHELEEVGLAEKALQNLAHLSGGKFYREENLHQLAADVPSRKVGFTRRQEIVLWNPLTFLLFVLLITAEWVVRKFSDLS